MCSLTGRVPMAQPPGRETLASPQRASSGPSARTLARILRTRSYGASWKATRVVSRRTRLSATSDGQPSRPSSDSVVEMSTS